jgi:hypothetical protein
LFGNNAPINSSSNDHDNLEYLIYDYCIIIYKESTISMVYHTDQFYYQ